MNNELNITLTTELRRLNKNQFSELWERITLANLLQSRIERYNLTHEEVAEKLGLGDKRQVTDVLRCGYRLSDKQIPASTIRRIMKYAGKGFYCCPGSLVNITKEIQAHQGDSDIDELQFVYLD